jgi:hypothetical protein
VRCEVSGHASAAILPAQWPQQVVTVRATVVEDREKVFAVLMFLAIAGMTSRTGHEADELERASTCSGAAPSRALAASN